jgi:hypothetical protein
LRFLSIYTGLYWITISLYNLSGKNGKEQEHLGVHRDKPEGRRVPRISNGETKEGTQEYQGIISSFPGYPRLP